VPPFLLDRDGVVVVNRKDDIKTPAGLPLIAGAADPLPACNQPGRSDISPGP
jgi:D-glycero-D-manno-heptose 1,7-bisphosphate phosphatase